MIYGEMNSTKRMWHIQIFANANCRRVLDFAMPRDSGGSLSSGIVVDAMLGSFAEEDAAVCFQMPNWVSSFQLG